VERSVVRLLSFFLILAAASFPFFRCSGVKPQTVSDDTFFEPLTSLDRTPVHKPATARPQYPDTTWIARADSLLSVMKEQERRLSALSLQFDRLHGARGTVPRNSLIQEGEQAAQPSKTPPQEQLAVAVTYQDALHLVRSRLFERALVAFQELVRRGIPNELGDNCHFWIGVSYYNLKQFDRAVVAFGQVIDWKGSNKKPDALYMLGQTHERLGSRQQAMVMFETLLKEFPTSELAPAARRKLSALGSIE